MPHNRSVRQWLVVIGVVALAIRLTFAWAIPLGAFPGDPNCAPDEADHFAIVRKLANGSVPGWPAHHTPYAAYLPTNYAAQALSLAVLGRLGLDRPILYRRPMVQGGLDGFRARAGR